MKPPRWEGQRFGVPTSTIGHKDYRGGSFLGKVWLEHQLVFIYHHGWVPKQIDHINRDTLDNRIENLRACSRRQNQYNKAKKRDATSRYFGVCWCKRRKKWIAQITADGIKQRLGGYDDEREAARVRDRAARRLHGEFAHLNFPNEFD